MKRSVLIALTGFFLAACAEVPETTSPLAPPQLKPAKKLTVTMTDLGTLGGLTSEALDINESGAIVGSSTLASGERRGFLWQNSVFTMLDWFGKSSRAEFINNAGLIAGLVSDLSGFRAIVWPAGGGPGIDIQPVGWVSSRPTALSENGLVVGSGGSGAGFHSFIWDGLESAQLPDLGGNVQAFAVNSAGDVVGAAVVTSGETHAFFWNNATGMTEIPPSPATTSARPRM